MRVGYRTAVIANSLVSSLKCCDRCTQMSPHFVSHRLLRHVVTSVSSGAERNDVQIRRQK